MNWFTSLFGSTDSAKKIVDTAMDGLSNGLDKAIYTKEEQADTATERFKMVYEFVAKVFDENSVRNITRRWLAWGICGWILLNAQVAVLCALLGKKEKVVAIIDIANAFELGWAFIGVLTAYFGVQFLRTRSAK